jgi:phage virion morphogenesis protein
MTGVSFNIQIDDRQVAKALEALLVRGDNLTPVHDDIGKAMVDKTQLRFESGQGPDGSPWPPSIRALAEGGLTLVDTGRLKQSMTHFADQGGVAWGTNVVYAAIHQLGGRAGRAGSVSLPARPFLGLDDDDLATIREAYVDFLAVPEAFGGVP